jgi:hypothetical protein
LNYIKQLKIPTLTLELFDTAGELHVLNCTFDNNEDGIFTPSGLPGQPAENVTLVVENCIFSKNTPNGMENKRQKKKKKKKRKVLKL